MVLPTGLIKSQKGTSQAVRRVKQSAKSSHPLCLSTLTLIWSFSSKGACQNNASHNEKLRSQALTSRLIPIQVESACFKDTSRILFRQLSPAGAWND